MRIKFINHAGFVIQHAGLSLMCDPWIHGQVFNNGWRLLSNTFFSNHDFINVDYIWFSHNHPDHFSPLSLAAIPISYRRKIRILCSEKESENIEFQCSQLEFKEIIKLNDSPYALAPDFIILNVPYRGGDSWLHCKLGSNTLLNTNDCKISAPHEAARIRRRIGPVDLLLTKFSYASWVGNPEQTTHRIENARKKLLDMILQVSFFNPSVTIPIANQAVFCHEENYYLNDHSNSPHDAYKALIQNGAGTAILYPGDEYEYGNEWDSTRSIERYNYDLKETRQSITSSSEFLSHNKPVPLIELKEKTILLLSQALRKNTNPLPQCYVYLWDYACSYLLGDKDSFIPSTVPRNSCFLELSSESLEFCLSHPKLADTVRLSGRMRLPPNGSYSDFLNFFKRFRDSTS